MDGPRRELLGQQGDLLIEQIRTKLEGPDLAELETRYVSFCEAMERRGRAR
jgi:hypothetical protein